MHIFNNFNHFTGDSRHGSPPGDRPWADFGGRRDDRRGPPFFGRGGRGFPGFGFGPGGPGGPGFPPGRKLSAADLQLVLLALLGEKASHGYDLIKAIEERSNGFYVPSPGVIYPALTYLEEAGDTVSEADGARKRYQLTDAGRAHLQRRRAEADALLAQLAEVARNMDRFREAFAGSSTDADAEESDAARDNWSTPQRIAAFIARLMGHQPEVAHAIHQLRDAISARRGASPDQWLKIAAVLLRAAKEIRDLDEPAGAGSKR